MRDLIPILVPITCGCVLPIMIIWFFIRNKMNDTNKRTEIVLAAIEKNPDMDIEELINKISPKKKLLKEKLLTKLLWGCITALLGIVLIGLGAWLGFVGGSDPVNIMTATCFGCILMAIGIAFFISYFIGKKMLVREIEAEAQQLTAQAGNK
ncbi:MAG: hypothetical protein J5637_07880 [Prevotella sp.]|nr:hypothetical protein [Prevotella sp.]